MEGGTASHSPMLAILKRQDASQHTRLQTLTSAPSERKLPAAATNLTAPAGNMSVAGRRCKVQGFVHIYYDRLCRCSCFKVVKFDNSEQDPSHNDCTAWAESLAETPVELRLPSCTGNSRVLQPAPANINKEVRSVSTCVQMTSALQGTQDLILSVL